eukprot:COSAG02_NODE_2134_length_9720_cov_3.845027_6_plen_161_part_00
MPDVTPRSGHTKATHILCPEHYARILWRDIDLRGGIDKVVVECKKMPDGWGWAETKPPKLTLPVQLEMTYGWGSTETEAPKLTLTAAPTGSPDQSSMSPKLTLTIDQAIQWAQKKAQEVLCLLAPNLCFVASGGPRSQSAATHWASRPFAYPRLGWGLVR